MKKIIILVMMGITIISCAPSSNIVEQTNDIKKNTEILKIKQAEFSHTDQNNNFSEKTYRDLDPNQRK